MIVFTACRRFGPDAAGRAARDAAAAAGGRCLQSVRAGQSRAPCGEHELHLLCCVSSCAWLPCTPCEDGLNPKTPNPYIKMQAICTTTSDGGAYVLSVGLATAQHVEPDGIPSRCCGRQPFALGMQVGRTLMSTQQMRERAGGKGRCVELLHAFGDML